MHENVPVRFGRGRLDSLVTKGLAAYLIVSSVGEILGRGRQTPAKAAARPDRREAVPGAADRS